MGVRWSSNDRCWNIVNVILVFDDYLPRPWTVTHDGVVYAQLGDESVLCFKYEGCADVSGVAYKIRTPPDLGEDWEGLRSLLCVKDGQLLYLRAVDETGCFDVCTLSDGIWVPRPAFNFLEIITANIHLFGLPTLETRRRPIPIPVTAQHIVNNSVLVAVIAEFIILHCKNRWVRLDLQKNRAPVLKLPDATDSEAKKVMFFKRHSSCLKLPGVLLPGYPLDQVLIPDEANGAQAEAANIVEGGVHNAA